MPAHRAVPWKLAPLLVASALLAACAGSPQRASGGDLRFDTETAGKLRHAAAVARSARGLAPAASRAASSSLAEWAPILLVLLKRDNAVNELHGRLVE